MLTYDPKRVVEVYDTYRQAVKEYALCSPEDEGDGVEFQIIPLPADAEHYDTGSRWVLVASREDC